MSSGHEWCVNGGDGCHRVTVEQNGRYYHVATLHFVPVMVLENHIGGDNVYGKADDVFLLGPATGRAGLPNFQLDWGHLTPEELGRLELTTGETE